MRLPGHRAYTYSYTRTNKGPFGGKLTIVKALTTTFDDRML